MDTRDPMSPIAILDAQVASPDHSAWPKPSLNTAANFLSCFEQDNKVTFLGVKDADLKALQEAWDDLYPENDPARAEKAVVALVAALDTLLGMGKR